MDLPNGAETAQPSAQVSVYTVAGRTVRSLVPLWFNLLRPLIGAPTGDESNRGELVMTETKLSEILEESFVRCRDLEAPLADRLQAFANELRA